MAFLAAGPHLYRELEIDFENGFGPLIGAELPSGDSTNTAGRFAPSFKRQLLTHTRRLVLRDRDDPELDISNNLDSPKNLDEVMPKLAILTFRPYLSVYEWPEYLFHWSDVRLRHYYRDTDQRLDKLVIRPTLVRRLRHNHGVAHDGVVLQPSTFCHKKAVVVIDRFGPVEYSITHGHPHRRRDWAQCPKLCLDLVLIFLNSPSERRASLHGTANVRACTMCGPLGILLYYAKRNVVICNIGGLNLNPVADEVPSREETQDQIDASVRDHLAVLSGGETTDLDRDNQARLRFVTMQEYLREYDWTGELEEEEVKPWLDLMKDDAEAGVLVSLTSEASMTLGCRCQLEMRSGSETQCISRPGD